MSCSAFLCLHHADFHRLRPLLGHSCLHRADFHRLLPLLGHSCLHRADFHRLLPLLGHSCLHRADFHRLRPLLGHSCLHRADFHRPLPPPGCSCALRSLSSGPRPGHSLRESYRTLQLPEGEEGSSPAEVKEAYLRLAKLYHPDSGAPTADAALFSRVEEAYRAVLAHASARAKEAEGEEGAATGSAPQHRHYLSFEGVGSGPPGQRERQYRQFRADRAADQVLEHRRRALERAEAGEGAMVARDTRLRSKQTKLTQTVERLVEDLIQESMARGDFSNLSGAGKPLHKFDYNPFADPSTHNLNRILIDNGYQPEWVVAQKEIQETVAKLRAGLLEVRGGLGDPVTPSEQARWQERCGAVADQLVKLNKKVDHFNLIVPLLAWQMLHFSLQRETERALNADQERRREREGEGEREREGEGEGEGERERERQAASTPQPARRGLFAWMQNFIK